VSKTPADYATWVRQVHELNGTTPRRIDLIDLTHRCGGQVVETHLDGCAGVLVRATGGWGILVHQNDSPRRRRFTLAHELGHFCIPTHHRYATGCVSPETVRSPKAKVIEREANAFAAELLMPKKVVSPMLRSGSINLKRSNELADVFDVSLVSAALRLSELTKEPTAVIYLQCGLIRWSIRHGFPWGIGSAGDAPPVGTVAYDIANGGSGSITGEEVDGALWLPLAAQSFAPRVVVESSVALTEEGGILSILWSPGSD
jgi:IrrE N-terminal-like domain